MATTILNGICRCCASEGVYKDVKTTYTWMGEEEVYSDMLRECFDISLTTAEHGEDGGICEVCITQLRNASNFKKQVQHTEEQFKKHVNNKLFKPSIVKVEVAVDDDNDSDDNMSAEEGFSAEFEVPIKTEIEEHKPKKRASTSKATTSRAKKSKNDNGEPSTKRVPKAATGKLKTQEKLSGNLKNKEVTTRAKTVSHRTYLAPVRFEVHKHRANIKEVLLWSNATPIRRHAGMGYMCCYCDEQFQEPTHLKKHTLETHKDVQKAYFMTQTGIYQFRIKLDITALRCKICDVNVNSLESLIEHLKIDHKKTFYTDIKNHIVPFKFDTETLQCCICTNTFSKFKNLQEHMSSHYRNYVCDICDVGFLARESLKRHMLCHETGTFKCDHCTLVFNTIIKKKKHINLMHSRKPAAKCMYCNETFNDYRKKERHLVSIHGLKLPTSKCQACERVFKTRRALTAHIKKNHLMERRHKCKECEMEFFESSELKYHMLQHTGVRPFKCTVCSKTFWKAKFLREHMNIHNNVRRYKCEHCDSAFVQWSSLNYHKRSKHQDIK